MLLTSADALRVGGSTVARAYVGAAQAWPPTGTVTTYLFPSDAAGRPAAPTQYQDSNAGMTIGTLFACSQAGTTATAIDAFIPYGVTMAPRLYELSGALLASGPAVTSTADGWYRLPLGSPYALGTAVDYVAATYQTGSEKYAAASGTFPATVGPLYTQDATSGIYAYGVDAAPTVTSAAWFCIDVVAEAA
jgi:hypothetical protein